MCGIMLCKLCCCTCYTHYCVDCSLSLYCVQSLIPSWVLFHVICSMLLCILLCTSRCCYPHCDVVAHVHVAVSTIAYHYIACNPSFHIGHFSIYDISSNLIFDILVLEIVIIILVDILIINCIILFFLSSESSF